MELVPSRIYESLGRQTFKSFDIKDSRIFRTTENLNYIANGQLWMIFYTKNFKLEVFKITNFKNLEEKFSKYVPSYSVSFSILKSLPFSLPSILIQVTNKGKTIYNSIVLSVSDFSVGKQISPLFLVLKSSKKNTVGVIHKVLEKLFGCHVNPVISTEAQTYWLFGICLHEMLRRDRSASDLTIKCKLTAESEIELSLFKESLKLIWDCVPNSCEDVLDINVIKKFKKELFEHFTQTYGINLTTAPIISLSLKDVYIIFDKHVMMLTKKPELSFSVLSYLEAEFQNC